MVDTVDVTEVMHGLKTEMERMWDVATSFTEITAPGGVLCTREASEHDMSVRRLVIRSPGDAYEALQHKAEDALTKVYMVTGAVHGIPGKAQQWNGHAICVHGHVWCFVGIGWQPGFLTHNHYDRLFLLLGLKRCGFLTAQQYTNVVASTVPLVRLSAEEKFIRAVEQGTK